MKGKKWMLCLLLALCLLPGCCGEASAASCEISSVTRVDPQNTVVMWSGGSGRFAIYRAETEDGTYSPIGTSSGASFRDGEGGGGYYYRVASLTEQGEPESWSAPVKTGVNPQRLDAVPVIMYHNFVTEEDQARGVVYEDYSITPQSFEEDLAYLRSHGYTAITSADLIEYLRGEKPLPEKAVILSIDDGTWGVYTNAFPLLKKYNFKADFNIIGEYVDESWEQVSGGVDRNGLAAPYCTWEELAEMKDSGLVNLCSHTYGFHHYDLQGRQGIAMKEGEAEEDYAEAVRSDFGLVSSSLTGWTGVTPRTLAYPYSRRSADTDRIIWENTSFEILMAGDKARATLGNYFVRGADYESQIRLMSRLCRMDGTPISAYLERIVREDEKNGVNSPADTLHLPSGDYQSIAASYPTFLDVEPDQWYSAGVYYVYVNGLLSGTRPAEFSPNMRVSNAVAASVLYRMAGSPDGEGGESWYALPMAWAEENGILPQGLEPLDVMTREELARAFLGFARYGGMDVSGRDDLSRFADQGDVSDREAMGWAVSQRIFNGDQQGRLDPGGLVTRAQLAVILQNWSMSR